MDQKYTINISLFFILLLLTISVYYPGLTGSFIFDDYTNIVENRLLQVENASLANFWQAAWSGESSPFGRPLSYLSFSINTHFSGLDARAMKITNLVIHLLTGLLLFLLTHKLLNYLNQTKQANIKVNLICTMTCAAWLLHPLNLTGVLYVVQRMTSLAALFTVCAMLCYTFFRIQQTKHSGYWFALVVSTTTFGLLGFFAKENAILLFFYLSCIEIFIFKFATYNSADKMILKACFFSVYTIGFISTILVLALNSEWLLNGYEYRNFTLTERLLTESRVLVWYLKMIVAPSIAEMSLYLDEFSISTSILQPISTILSIAFLMLFMIIAFLIRNRFALVTFGIFWFFSGHLLESTLIPLELIFEHRNYLPLFGILLAVFFIAEQLLNNIKLRYIIAFTSIVWISLITYTTVIRVEQWKNPLALALADIEYHPNSVRANSALAGVYAGLVRSSKGEINEEVFSLADTQFKKAIKLETGSSGNLVGRLALYSVHGKELPRSEFDSIIESLKQKEIDAGAHNALKGLTFCLIDGICNMSTEDYMALMYAPLSRIKPGEKLSAHDKIFIPHLLIYLSEYYAAVLKDFDTAIHFIENAIEEQPKKYHFRFLLVKNLANSGQYDEAIKELELIKKKDKFSMYTANIKQWENLITAALEKTGNS